MIKYNIQLSKKKCQKQKFKSNNSGFKIVTKKNIFIGKKRKRKLSEKSHATKWIKKVIGEFEVIVFC